MIDAATPSLHGQGRVTAGLSVVDGLIEPGRDTSGGTHAAIDEDAVRSLMDRALDLDSEARDRWLAELADGLHAALHPIVAQMIASRAGMDTAFLVQPSLSGGVTARRSFEGGAAVAGGRVGPYLLKANWVVAVWAPSGLAARDDGSLARDVAPKLPALRVSEALGQRFQSRARHSRQSGASEHRAPV